MSAEWKQQQTWTRLPAAARKRLASMPLARLWPGNGGPFVVAECRADLCRRGRSGHRPHALIYRIGPRGGLRFYALCLWDQLQPLNWPGYALRRRCGWRGAA